MPSQSHPAPRHAARHLDHQRRFDGTPVRANPALLIAGAFVNDGAVYDDGHGAIGGNTFKVLERRTRMGSAEIRLQNVDAGPNLGREGWFWIRDIVEAGFYFGRL